MICAKCGKRLFRIVVANIVDFKHPGGTCIASLDQKDSWEPAARHYRDLGGSK